LLEAAEMRQGFDEPLLHGIERIGFVPQHTKRDPVGRATIAEKQQIERVSVALLIALQELSIVILGRRGSDVRF